MAGIKELTDVRNLVKVQLIRTYQLSLTLHKEQEHIENIMGILDNLILKEEQKDANIK